MPKRPHFSVAVFIDESECSPEGVRFHSQDDPYPGGHRHALTLQRKGIAEYVLPGSASNEAETRRYLSRGESHGTFQCVSCLLSNLGANRGSKPLYVLNTIDT